MKDNDAHENGDSDSDGCYYDSYYFGYDVDDDSDNYCKLYKLVLMVKWYLHDRSIPPSAETKVSKWPWSQLWSHAGATEYCEWAGLECEWVVSTMGTTSIDYYTNLR